jgi:myo-inositol 2-dehydrogenase / D-chiro-inositol 1-dehydrogenase
MNHENSVVATRREFLRTSSIAAAGVAASPFILTGRAAELSPGDTIKIGLVGCGGRGSGAAKQALNSDSNVQLVAVADAFEDNLNRGLAALKADMEVGEKVRVEPEKKFVGLDAYEKLINSGVDLVILTSPPGFRPLHLKAAIEAGKHVFCEKPMATDAAGVRSLMASVAEAKRKNLAIGAGFCWRYNSAERAIMKQIHEGAIGDIRTYYGTYNTGLVGRNVPRKDGMGDIEYQVRNWFFYTWLSGDHLVEQCIHTVDKMMWAFKDEPPVKCVAHGGRQVRTAPEYGNIYDHFEVVYEWASGARGFVFCRQQANCANDNSDVIYGTKGTGRILGFASMPWIKNEKGENVWRYSGPRPDMYQVEHNELVASIRAGKPINDGPWMTSSTLAGIMGRMAAYTGKEVTWEHALNSKEDLVPQNLDMKAEFTPPPVAMPGKTPLI